MLDSVDPLCFSTIKVTALYDGEVLSHATGFFWYGLLNNKPNYWFVTNWHVACGRNADNPAELLSSRKVIPTHLRIMLRLREDQPEYNGRTDNVLFEEQTIALYDGEGHAMWYQHPLKNLIDVAVLNAGPLDRFKFTAVNGAEQGDMAIEIGNEVFILGYPLGYSHFMGTPIWKRGSIASEPHLKVQGDKERVAIDATTRTGMSGAPVFMRAKTHYVTEAGEIKQHKNATRFIGVYASRPTLIPLADDRTEDRSAEVGYFYKSGSISDAILKGIRGPDAMTLP